MTTSCADRLTSCPGFLCVNHGPRLAVTLTRLVVRGEEVAVLRGEISRCSCCHRDCPAETSLTFGGSTVFCEPCRPSDDILDDPEELAALVDELHGHNAPRCPHRAVIGQE